MCCMSIVPMIPFDVKLPSITELRNAIVKQDCDISLQQWSTAIDFKKKVTDESIKEFPINNKAVDVGESTIQD